MCWFKETHERNYTLYILIQLSIMYQFTCFIVVFWKQIKSVKEIKRKEIVITFITLHLFTNSFHV